MITISACLIVKNEEKVLERCLKSLQGLYDELIIVDTGSTDNTKEIARKYTDLVYDYTWIDDFSAARNYSFSKATMDYIYVADADEVIDMDNYNKFLTLKKHLMKEIEIVQMHYTNQLEFNATYNYNVELRPKLYKRLREFSWIDPIHESVRLEPVIYDSDIEIMHLPLSNHGPRDFNIFQKVLKRGEGLSKKLRAMYARELYIVGTNEDFLTAKPYFCSLLGEVSGEESENLSQEENQIKEVLEMNEIRYIQCILARCARIENDMNSFLKNSLKHFASNEACSELCFEVGEYFFENKDYKEATIWYYNAAFETKSELNIHYQGDYPLERLAECYGQLGNQEEYDNYMELKTRWLREYNEG